MARPLLQAGIMREQAFAEEAAQTLAPLAINAALQIEHSLDDGSADLGLLHGGLREGAELIRLLRLLRCPGDPWPPPLLAAFLQLKHAIKVAGNFLDGAELELYLQMVKRPNSPRFGGEMVKVLLSLRQIQEVAKDQLDRELKSNKSKKG
jgi:hypothetical protein